LRNPRLKKLKSKPEKLSSLKIGLLIEGFRFYSQLGAFELLNINGFSADFLLNIKSKDFRSVFCLTAFLYFSQLSVEGGRSMESKI